MPTAATIRSQIESALAQKIPAALSPSARVFRPLAATGIAALDERLNGGFPLGAVTELTGPECCGRTSIALAFLARISQAEKVCAWIDAGNALDPASAAAAGVDLGRLLWVRCGYTPEPMPAPRPPRSLPVAGGTPRPPIQGLHGGGCGPHPRTEARGISQALPALFQQEPAAPEHAAALPLRGRLEPPRSTPAAPRMPRRLARPGCYAAIERALRCTDLLLQTGGFGALVLDLAGMAPEMVSRIELSTWHRYRVAAEKSQASLVLLTQYPCARSSSELQLRVLPAELLEPQTTVFAGMQLQVEVTRQRFAPDAGQVFSMRKPPRSASATCWANPTSWAGLR
jgi:recombination protein RecA